MSLISWGWWQKINDSRRIFVTLYNKERRFYFVAGGDEWWCCPVKLLPRWHHCCPEFISVTGWSMRTAGPPLPVLFLPCSSQTVAAHLFMPLSRPAVVPPVWLCFRGGEQLCGHEVALYSLRTSVDGYSQLDTSVQKENQDVFCIQAFNRESLCDTDVWWQRGESGHL